MVKRQKDRHQEAGIIIKADSWSKCMVIGWSRWATIADSLGIRTFLTNLEAEIISLVELNVGGAAQYH